MLKKYAQVVNKVFDEARKQNDDLKKSEKDDEGATYIKDTTEIQPGYIKDTTEIQPGYIKDTTEIQPGYIKDTTEIILSGNQAIVYDWFMVNGLTGHYSVGKIADQTKIPKISVRSCIKKLRLLDILDDKYHQSIKVSKYIINSKISIEKI